MSRHTAAGSALCIPPAPPLMGRAGPVSERSPPSTTIPPPDGRSTAEWPERTLGANSSRSSALGGSLHERLGVWRIERESPLLPGAHPIT